MEAKKQNRYAANYTLKSIVTASIVGIVFFFSSVAIKDFAFDDVHTLALQLISSICLASLILMWRRYSSLKRQNIQTEVARDLAEEGLKSQQITAIVSDRMRGLGEMAAGLAHELNQPLTGIRGTAEHLDLNLERDWQLDKENFRSKLQRILEQTDRITELIDHVRTFAKESKIPNSSAISLNLAARQSTKIFGAQLKHHNITLEVNLDDKLPLVQANPFALEEVMFALVANARDSFEDNATPLGPEDATPGTLTIKTTSQLFGGTRWAKLEVVDNGAGMSEEVAQRAFDLFFTTKEPGKGTGLGLSVARSIIEQFGGTVDLLSTLGEGTTVTIMLPETTINEIEGGSSR